MDLAAKYLELAAAFAEAQDLAQRALVALQEAQARCVRLQGQLDLVIEIRNAIDGDQ